MASFGDVFRIAPPIMVTEGQLNLALAIIEEALRTTPGTMPLYDDREALNPSATNVEVRL
jgi:hypothetical protein